MKKTFNINLNGQLFCIDDDAYNQLQVYIEKLEKYYLTEKDGQEIMADIESRIAELLRISLQKSHREIISLSDILQVIEIMGSPETIIEEDTQSSASPQQEIPKKLYRDADNRILGGVASGLSIYLGLDAVWLRLAFIVLSFFYGITILLYLILWIIVPKAITPKQKMEMQGKGFSVADIEKNIRDTYTNFTKKN